MRSDDEIQKIIDRCGNDGKWWYQPIKFKDNVMTHSNKWSDAVFYSKRTFGINKWNNFVIPFLPFALENKTILDIGCNAGIFLIQAIRAGAKFAYGIEPDGFNLGFYNQCTLVMDMFSEIDEIDYNNKIKIINKECNNVDWKKDFLYKIDITFAYNVLYWLTFSDENGSIPQAEKVLKSILENISKTSKYLIIMGDEKDVKSARRRKCKNYLGTSVDKTLPLLNDYDIEKVWIEDSPIERNPSIIVAKSKNI